MTRLILTVCTLTAICLHPAEAQVLYGSIVGTVTEQSEAVASDHRPIFAVLELLPEAPHRSPGLLRRPGPP